MKDPGCSRRTRASGRRAGAPSNSRRYGWREAQAQAARTRERQDSRAMRYKVCLSSIDTEHLQHLSFCPHRAAPSCNMRAKDQPLYLEL